MYVPSRARISLLFACSFMVAEHFFRDKLRVVKHLIQILDFRLFPLFLIPCGAKHHAFFSAPQLIHVGREIIESPPGDKIVLELLSGIVLLDLVAQDQIIPEDLHRLMSAVQDGQSLSGETHQCGAPILVIQQLFSPTVKFQILKFFPFALYLNF